MVGIQPQKQLAQGNKIDRGNPPIDIAEKPAPFPPRGRFRSGHGQRFLDGPSFALVNRQELSNWRRSWLIRLADIWKRLAASPVVKPKANALAMRRLHAGCPASQAGKSRRNATCSGTGVA